MTIDDLVKIVCIAEEQNISRASKRLFVSQPSLSQAIQRVEKAIKQQLFTRSPSGLALTPAGEEIIRLAKEIIQIKGDLDTNLTKMSTSRTVQFSIGLPSFWALSILPAILPKFREKYPNLEIFIKEATAEQMESMLLCNEIDIAITPLGTYSEKIINHFLFKDELMVSISPENPLSSFVTELNEYPCTLEPEALRGQAFILNQKMPEIIQAANRFFVAYNIEPQTLMFANNMETIKHLTLNNLGISFIPRSYT
ncbi:MAG: LysR family transcriptional regulator, partial [Bacillota bacterium]